MEGTWSVEVGAKDGLGESCWEYCTLKISSGGTVEAGGTYTDCLGEIWEITGGKLTISSGCEIQGTIHTSKGPLYIETGAMVGDDLVLGLAEN